MLNLLNQTHLGRKLVDASRLAFVFAVPNASAGRWSRVYENFVRSDRLCRLQNEALEVEHDCLRWQNTRLQCQQQLITAQSKLKDLHVELRNVSTADKNYPAMVAEELQILKSVRALSYDFHQQEEAEKEKFLFLERILAESRKEEWSKAKRSHRFFVYVCLVGLAFGITGTLTSIFLHEYLLEDPELKNNRLLRELATKLASVIDGRNKVIQTFLQDVAVLLDVKPVVLICNRDVALPLSDDDDVVALSAFQEALDIFGKKNKEYNEEMTRLLSLLWNRQQSHNLHTVVLLPKETEVPVAPDISPLWRTTFVYSLLAVGVPLAYCLLT